MEAICVKLDKGIMKEINEIAKEFHYTTRTDFIREAIRSKIEELQKKRALKNLDKITEIYTRLGDKDSAAAYSLEKEKFLKKERTKER